MSGKIIKKTISRPESDDVAESESSLIDGEIYDASQTAKELIQKADRQAETTVARARGEAQGIVQEARQEQERLIREATDQGYQEGLASATEWVVRAKNTINGRGWQQE
jgi:cell division septum initiation protein DivIVA